tara:strand:- start:188 stop:538 length:351 start_codon:yes stop_codon:yes gene_type:complete
MSYHGIKTMNDVKEISDTFLLYPATSSNTTKALGRIPYKDRNGNFVLVGDTIKGFDFRRGEDNHYVVLDYMKFKHETKTQLRIYWRLIIQNIITKKYDLLTTPQYCLIEKVTSGDF